MDSAQLQTQSETIERLLDELSASISPRALEQVETLVTLVVGLYGAGLERLLQRVRAAGLGPDGLRQVCDDELVRGLLVVHGIHPDDALARVEQALDQLTAQLGAPVDAIRLIELDDAGTLTVRVAGDRGCAGSWRGIEEAIAEAVAAAAPEVARIRINSDDAGSSGLIPVNRLVRTARESS